MVIPMDRPFVYINSATSVDGKLSSVERRQVRISCQEDRERVKGLRADSDAIMVGIGTVLADDPHLRIKSEELRKRRVDRGLPKTPLRVVVDSRARTPADAKVLGDGCILAVSGAAPSRRLEKLLERCEIVTLGAVRVDLSELLCALHKKGVRRLMVEGGATLNFALVEAGLVDEMSVYVGPLIIGGERAPTLVDGAGFREGYPRLDLVSIERIGEGALFRWRFRS